MLLRRTIGAGCLAAILLVSLATPREARAATPPLLVRDTETQLMTAGCERVEVADKKAMQAARALDWREVVPSDATGEALLFCPPAMAGGVRPVGTGQVAGLTKEAQAGLLDNIKTVGENVGTISWSDLVEHVGSPKIGALKIGSKLFTGKGLGEHAVSAASDLAAGAIAGFFSAVTMAALLIMENVVQFLPFLLTESAFINSTVVQRSWPIVLGVANGGFLLALVFIALLTVLRLDVGGGVRRLLPRLLIAALLVNFSLVIAGFILDLSRVVMALIPFVMNAGSVDTLPGKIMLESAGWKIWLNFALEDGTVGWKMAGTSLVNAISAWVVLAAVLIVIIGLLIRYVVLLLLLIVSPLAYLFIALPGAGGLAMQWWKTFIRYVIYGPVVLALLIIAVYSRSLLGDLYEDLGFASGLWLAFFEMALFVTFMIFAALAGRYAGIIGSATTISLATGAGRRVRGMAYRGAKGTVRGTGRGIGYAARVSGATELAKRPFRQVRDYLRERGKPYRKALGIGEYSQYDKKGRPKPGVVTTGMRKGREGAMDAKTRGLVDNVRQANTGYAAAQSAGKPFDSRTYPGLRGENLQKPEVAGAMSPELMKGIMQRGTDEQKLGLNAGISSSDSLSKEQVDVVVEVAEAATTDDQKQSARTTMESMVNNVNVVANMTPDQKSNLTGAAYRIGDPRVIGLLHTIMDRVKRSQERRDQA